MIGGVVELDHDSAPRFLIVAEFPERVTLEDLTLRRYGKLLDFDPSSGGDLTPIVYRQPDGPGTDWVRPG